MITDPQAARLARYDWLISQAEWHGNMRFCDMRWHDSQRTWYVAQAFRIAPFRSALLESRRRLSLDTTLPSQQLNSKETSHV